MFYNSLENICLISIFSALLSSSELFKCSGPRTATSKTVSIITYFTDGFSKQTFKHYNGKGNVRTHLKRTAMLK